MVKKFLSLLMIAAVMFTACNQDEIDSLKSDVSELEEKIEQMEADKAALMTQIENLETQVGDLTAANTSLQADLDALTSQLADLQAELDAEKAKIFYGDVITAEQYAALAEATGATVIIGNVVAETAEHASTLANIATIGGNLVTMVNLPNLEMVSANMSVEGITVEEGADLIAISFNMLKTVGGEFLVNKNDGMGSLEAGELLFVGGDFTITGNGYIGSVSFVKLTEVVGNFKIYGNSASSGGINPTYSGLSVIQGDFTALTTIGGDFDLTGNKNLTTVKDFNAVTSLSKEGVKIKIGSNHSKGVAYDVFGSLTSLTKADIGFYPSAASVSGFNALTDGVYKVQLSATMMVSGDESFTPCALNAFNALVSVEYQLDLRAKDVSDFNALAAFTGPTGITDPEAYNYQQTKVSIYAYSTQPTHPANGWTSDLSALNTYFNKVKAGDFDDAQFHTVEFKNNTTNVYRQTKYGTTGTTTDRDNYIDAVTATPAL
ncbi:hypothetical protein [Carboxylicivirga sp. RSCT41]|uniref:hypothetical protein n=1 Tax=Carboxylicivirga agarovorans TaxID=3417570 RepID=UPI003D3313F1